MAKIKDNQTGQIFEVPDSELGQYGLDTQSTSTSAPTSSSISPSANKYVTGYSLEDHAQALSRAKQAGDAAGVKSITDDYNREMEYQKSFNKKPDAAKLRKEFNMEAKATGFPEVQKSWQKVSNAPKTASGDLTILYSYIKALDPDSVVREGEINLTKAAESVPSQITRAYQQAKEGKVISDKLRGEMIDSIGGIYNERAKKQQELNAFYSGLATDTGVDPTDVIGGMGEIEMAQLPKRKELAQQADGPTGLAGILSGAIEGPGKTLLDLLAGNAIRTGKKVGGTIQDTADMGKALIQSGGKPTQVQLDPNRPRLPQEIVSPTMEDITSGKGIMSMFKEGGPAALDLASVAQLPGAVKSAPKLLGGILPKKGSMELAAKEAGNLKMNKVIQAGNKFVSHEPAAKELWKAVKPTIKKNTPATDVLAKMFDVWKKAYSKGGDVKGTAEAQLYNKLYGAARKTIEKQAPELSKEIGKRRLLHKVPELAQKASWMALKTAGVGKLLGL